MDKKSIYKYLFSLLLFGANGVLASQISLSSYEIVFLRTLIGSIFLIIIFKLGKRTSVCLQNRRHLAALILSGAALGCSWLFLFEAYRQVGVSMASLAYYCGPILVMLFSPLLFQEHLTWPKLAGFLAVFAGVLCINLQAAQERQPLWGLVCGLLSAVMYAAMVIFSKKAPSITGLENSMLQLTAAFLTVAIYVGCRQGFLIHLAPGDWLPVLVLGFFNTGFGCYLYFSAIGRLPVQTVAICGYLEPLSAVLFSVLFLREAMGPLQVLGAGLILGGAMFGECFPLCRKQIPLHSRHTPHPLAK